MNTFSLTFWLDQHWSYFNRAWPSRPCLKNCQKWYWWTVFCPNIDRLLKWSGKKVMKKVFNWSEVHLYRSNFLQNSYFSGFEAFLTFKWFIRRMNSFNMIIQSCFIYFSDIFCAEPNVAGSYAYVTILKGPRYARWCYYACPIWSMWLQNPCLIWLCSVTTWNYWMWVIVKT